LARRLPDSNRRGRNRELLEDLASTPPKRSRRLVLVQISQRSRLQGLTPLASPSCHTTVAGDATLDPSMGFDPLQGPQQSAPSQRCRSGERCLAEPKFCLPAPVPSSAAASCNKLQVVESLQSNLLLPQPRLGRKKHTGEPKPRPTATPFQRRCRTPDVRRACSGPKPVACAAVPPKSVRRALS
jgi:hypothetical protein